MGNLSEKKPLYKLVVLLLVYFGALLFTSVLSAICILALGKETGLLVALIVSTPLAIGGTAVVYSLVFEKKFADFGLFRFSKKSCLYLLAAVILFFVSTPLVSFFSPTQSYEPTLLSLCKNADAFKVAALVLAVALLPAFFEEWVFRGIVQNRIVEAFNGRKKPLGGFDLRTALAIVVSAALFSAVHFDLSGMMARFVLGLLLGLIYFYSSSLWPGILLHFTNNLIALIGTLLYAQNPGQDETTSPLYLALLSLVVLVAGFYLVAKLTVKSKEIGGED